MRNLIEYISEKNWSDKVDTDWSPEEGLFTRKDPNYIAKYLLDHSKMRDKQCHDLSSI